MCIYDVYMMIFDVLRCIYTLIFDDDDVGACLMYIADRYDSACTTPADRAKFCKWVVWANSELGTCVCVYMCIYVYLSA